MTQEPDGVAPIAGRTWTRVRYPETDAMGVAHHSHYLVWFELGRTELMRELGIPYSEVEQEGVSLPVIEVGAVYRASARYDERLSIDTRLAWARGARVRFEYAVRREGESEALAKGFTVHAAVDRKGRARRLPDRLARVLDGRLPRERA